MRARSCRPQLDVARSCAGTATDKTAFSATLEQKTSQTEAARPRAGIANMTLSEFEQDFTVYPACGDKRLAPTGEPYVAIGMLIEGSGASEAVAFGALLGAVRAYAHGKAGMLYWRMKPEVQRVEEPLSWRCYARLLISDKPIVAPD